MKAHGPSDYRKKPVAVKAMMFKPRARMWPPEVYETGHQFFVRTASGPVEIVPGDFICWQKLKGRLDVWPVKQEIFFATYEPCAAPSTGKATKETP